MIKLIKKYKKVIIIILLIIILFISIYYFYKKINEQFYNEQFYNEQFYNTNETQWEQLGQDINGDKNGKYSGNQVSLSSDGKIIAIGNMYSNQVKVYKLDVDITQNTSIWTQLGQDLDGELGYYEASKSLSLSSDGQIIAIGSSDNTGINGPWSGSVTIYKLDTTQTPPIWNKLGQNIDGANSSDYSGSSISLSSDGQIIAIGSVFHDGINGDDSGHVRIYKLDNTQNEPVWKQLGKDIYGESIFDHSGSSVSLSSNGQIVAIGSSNNNSNGYYSGHVRIFKLDTTQNSPVWVQLGQNINGDMPGDKSGSSVSLSSNGQIVAISSPNNNNNINGFNLGHVRIYKLNTTQSLPVWIQLGQNIDGVISNYYNNTTLSLSSDGQIIAIGSPQNTGINGEYSGQVRIFKLDITQTPSIWTNLGQTINGEAREDYSGASISLSSDGQIVAIGSPYNNNNGDYSGHVRIFKYNSEEPTTTMPSTTTTMPSTTTTMPSTTTTMPSTTTTMPSTTTTMPITTTTMPITTTTMPITTTTQSYNTIPLTTQNSITNNYDDYNIGMMLKGNNNTGNLNDFLAKNTLLGNNLYISPMNQSGIVGDDYDSNLVKNNKIIDSTFTPMIKLG